MKQENNIRYKVLYKPHSNWFGGPLSNTFKIYENAVAFADKHPWAQVWEVETKTYMCYGNGFEPFNKGN